MMNIRCLLRANLLAILLLLSLLFWDSLAESSDISKAQKSKTGPPIWELCNQMGITHFVYISPGGLKNRCFVAQLLNMIVHKFGRGKLIEIHFFDDKRYCPTSFPMTDEQMLHLKARYNYNPRTKFEEFVRFSVVNRKTSPPQLKETKDNIRPGVAD